MDSVRLDLEIEDKYTLGDNSVWASIINKTWGWPYLRCQFMQEDKILGIFTAIKMPDSWVSFPHFTQSSCIYFAKNSPVESDQKLLKLQLRNIFIDCLSRWQAGDQQEIEIELDQSLLLSNTDKKQNQINYKSRDFEPLSPFHLSNKTISFLHLPNHSDEHIKSLPSGVRHKIKKANRNGIRVIFGGAKLLGDFYPVYRQNIQRLGSFGLPKRFFENLLHLAPDRSAIFIAQKETKTLGAAILLKFDSHAENAWFASSIEGNKQYVTYALHFAMQEMTIKNGISLYSFGSSTKGSSVETYKKQWGTIEKTLYLNSSNPIRDIKKISGLINSILRYIPYRITMLFDNRISHWFY